jgi:hypothetical protein
LAVADLDATINVKPEPQNRRLEPTGLAKPSETRGLTGMGPGLALQESAGRVFWMGLEPNWPVFVVQTRTAGALPGPIANTIPEAGFGWKPAQMPWYGF